MTILDDIVSAKRLELEHQKTELPLSALEERIAAQSPPLNLSSTLLGDRVRLIAEVKKSSPSRGLLCANFDAISLAKTYVENGASAISVLTDSHFEGTLEHLSAVKQAVLPSNTPVLRKDFIFDPYQVYEARAAGADALLLIVAILSPSQLKELLAVSGELWVQCLVEVHNEAELKVAVEAGAEIIGINNRNLHTFNTDLSVTERLAPKVPPGKVIVSESGINAPEHINQLSRLKVNAALVGEALLTSPDVGAKVRQLLGQATSPAALPTQA